MRPYASVLDAGTSLTNKTGSWRIEKPSYVHLLPPCNKACPAGENIQEWLSLVERERYEEAWGEIVKNNPLPAIMGRVCYHPCESACNRVAVDSVVGINSVERFLGDMAIEKKWSFAKPKASSGKKVLVVGAGPAGLSAAYHLALAGHKVTIMEALPKAGGMLRYGIPQYRLPRDVLDTEIERILALGVALRTNEKITDIKALLNKKEYDACFVALGAHIAKTTSFPDSEGFEPLDAVAFLREMEDKPPSDVAGKRIAVYGGGNTALDVARTAKRLGAASVTVVYRRSRENMPAHAFEVDEALQENIKIKFLSTIKSCDGDCLTLEKMVLDGKGTAQPTGQTETMQADRVVLALGQDADLSPFEKMDGLTKEKGFLQIDAQMKTGYEGLFAGGDMVTATRTVTTAIGHGKKAARQIDRSLRGQSPEAEPKHQDAASGNLNTWYYAKSERAERKSIDGAKRANSFEEVQKGLPQEQALQEARRCLSCGNCFECDNCYGLCPDNAIRKLGEGKGFEIDYDYCKGCGLCAAECPCGCIAMTPETI